MSAETPTSSELPPSSYPDLEATSPTDSVIQGDFGTLSSAEQERQRDEWKAELAKTEDEILTLRQVLTSKEAHAAGLKRRLGITQWREFSEDMQQGLKNLQESAAYKKTAESLNAAKTKTASMMSSVVASATASTHGWSFGGVSEKMTGALGAAKNRVAASFSHQNLSGETAKGEGAKESTDGGDAPVTSQPVKEEK